MIVYCEECDRQLDADYIEFIERDGNEICLECYLRLTPPDAEIVLSVKEEDRENGK